MERGAGLLCIMVVIPICGMNCDTLQRLPDQICSMHCDRDEPEHIPNPKISSLQELAVTHFLTHYPSHEWNKRKYNREIMRAIIKRIYTQTNDEHTYIIRIATLRFWSEMEEMARIIAKRFDQVPVPLIVGSDIQSYLVQNRKTILEHMMYYPKEMVDLIWKYRRTTSS